MSLETYVKQLTTWQGVNEDVPDYAKYHELIEELKKNKDIKGLQRFIATTSCVSLSLSVSKSNSLKIIPISQNHENIFEKSWNPIRENYFT